MVDPRVEGIRSVLVRLRTRSGLSADRLRSTEVDVQLLAALPVVRHHLESSGGEPADAVVHAIRHLAGRLGTTDKLIVDAALALGLLRRHRPAAPDLDALYGGDLGDRRAWLSARWTELHELDGAAEIPQAPSVRALRTTLEVQALGRLAELCVTTSALDSGHEVEIPRSRRPEPAAVVVVGGAVMDDIYVVDQLPEFGTSVQALAHDRHPGGKGLVQAVASARLGIDVHLLASVGEDADGDAILDFMAREGLRTDLVKRVPSGRTPVAMVAINQTGSSATIGWKNESQVGLLPEDLASGRARLAIERASAVLVTFEVPVDALRRVFEIARHGESLLLVHPSPRLEAPQLLYEYLSGIDFLVGSPWELRALLPDSGADGPTTDQLATQLLLLGVRTVCVLESFSCHVRSATLNLDIERVPTPMHDRPGSRDAFTAALTYRAITSDGDLGRSDYGWAVGAMAAAPAYGKITPAMPSAAEIDQVVALAPGLDEK